MSKETKKEATKNKKKNKAVDVKKTAKIKKVVKTDKKETAKIVSRNELFQLIKIGIIVTVIFVAFYGITILVTKMKNNKKEDTDETAISATIQYDKILVGQILTRDADKYYVLVEYENDPYTELYNNYLSIYKEKENALKTYNVDLSDTFNKEYVGDSTEILGTDSSKYKFNGSVLIKVSKGKETKVKAYTTKDEIITQLEKLIK